MRRSRIQALAFAVGLGLLRTAAVPASAGDVSDTSLFVD